METPATPIDREVPEVPPLTRTLLSDELLFSGPDGAPNPEILSEHFVGEGKLSEAQLTKILNRGIDLLKQEQNLIRVEAPIVIVGDIHGQFYDLLKMFEVAGGMPPKQRFLFLGDYVDRGYFSIECFLYLLALKINHPQHIYLLRGNHECRHLTRHFTFRLECVYKYSEALYDTCMSAFDALPLAAVVSNQLFCVHGGIGPDLKDPEDVNQLNRFSDPPKTGLFCDLLWSDPDQSYGSEGLLTPLFPSNSSRGCSYRYTYKAVSRFLGANNLLAIVRGHEAQNTGYRLYDCGKPGTFPTVITVFSAPNYCDAYNNKAAIIKYDNEVLNIKQFKEVPHPYYLPKFMNAFDWSLPFVGEKIAELLMAVLQIPTLDASIEGLSSAEKEKLERENEELDEVLKQKIVAIGKVGQIFSNIRKERESLTELENTVGITSLPSEELTVGDDILRDAIESFEEAKESDSVNEQLPDRGTLSISPIPEAVVEFPSPKLAEITQDDVISQISEASDQEKSISAV